MLLRQPVVIMIRQQFFRKLLRHVPFESVHNRLFHFMYGTAFYVASGSCSFLLLFPQNCPAFFSGSVFSVFSGCAIMIYLTSSNRFLSYLLTRMVTARWPCCATIPSDYNLSKFIAYIHGLPDHDQERLTKLPVMQHVPTCSPAMFKNSKNKFVQLRQTMCTERECRRCNDEVGGYRFQFIGPWTCHKIITQCLPPLIARQTWMKCQECLLCAKSD